MKQMLSENYMYIYKYLQDIKSIIINHIVMRKGGCVCVCACACVCLSVCLPAYLPACVRVCVCVAQPTDIIQGFYWTSFNHSNICLKIMSFLLYGKKRWVTSREIEIRSDYHTRLLNKITGARGTSPFCNFLFTYLFSIKFL